MSYDDIRDSYVLYIGAGAVAAGGIISVFQALPLILSSIAAGIRDLRATRRGEASGARTDRDMPLATVGIGSVVLVAAIWATTPLHAQFSWIPDLHMHWLGACLIVLFGFLFVTVSSRLTGEIGSSSNPISGMTVATLLLTCLIFVAIGWTRPDDRLTALSIAAVVCIAASNGGTTSQDLKTGYLVGATPKWQQWAIVVGALSSALVIGIILIRLNDAYTIYTQKNLPTPEVAIPIADLTEKARAKGTDDDTEYRVWRASEGNKQEVPPGEYLVDDEGNIRYLVDPGINGQRKQRDDGTEVVRFNAPKARLMALITDGVLSKNLPWDLVLIGVFIAVVLELCSIPSLAFAVGVYLPMSASTPILAGGLVRWCVERARRRPAPRAAGALACRGRAPGADSRTPASRQHSCPPGYIAERCHRRRHHRLSVVQRRDSEGDGDLAVPHVEQRLGPAAGRGHRGDFWLQAPMLAESPVSCRRNNPLAKTRRKRRRHRHKRTKRRTRFRASTKKRWCRASGRCRRASS